MLVRTNHEQARRRGLHRQLQALSLSSRELDADALRAMLLARRTQSFSSRATRHSCASCLARVCIVGAVLSAVPCCLFFRPTSPATMVTVIAIASASLQAEPACSACPAVNTRMTALRIHPLVQFLPHHAIRRSSKMLEPGCLLLATTLRTLGGPHSRQTTL